MDFNLIKLFEETINKTKEGIEHLFHFHKQKPKIRIPKKETYLEKLRKMSIPNDLSDEVKNALLELKGEIEIFLTEAENIDYSPYDTKERRMLYAYYYLLGTKQIAMDYFPQNLNIKLIPLLDKNIERLKSLIYRYKLYRKKERKQSEPIIYNEIENYVSTKGKVSNVKVNIPLYNFDISLDKEMFKIQAKEKEEFGKILEPTSPFRKVALYIVTVEDLIGNQTLNLTPVKKLLINYAEKKLKQSYTEDEAYKYYINTIQSVNY
jgi:hypothetical protein